LRDVMPLWYKTVDGRKASQPPCGGLRERAVVPSVEVIVEVEQ